MSQHIKLAKKSLADANRASDARVIEAYSIRTIANLMMAQWEEDHERPSYPDTGPG